MNNLQKINLRDRPEKKNSLSLSNINSEFKKSPVIIVESDKHVVVDGMTLSIDDVSIDISEMKMYELVKYMNTNGVDTKFINTAYVMYPAVMISDFNSQILRMEIINTSPKNIYEFGLKNMSAIVGLSDSVEFNIQEIYDEDVSYDFVFQNGKIYTNAATESYVSYNEKYTKYIMFIQSEKAIVASSASVENQLSLNIIEEMNTWYQNNMI